MAHHFQRPPARSPHISQAASLGRHGVNQAPAGYATARTPCASIGRPQNFASGLSPTPKKLRTTSPSIQGPVVARTRTKPAKRAQTYASRQHGEVGRGLGCCSCLLTGAAAHAQALPPVFS
jgi:hypothetical protein